MLRPLPLRAGDVVRVVALSGPVDPSALESGLRVLRERFGLVPRVAGDILARRMFLAGTDEQRARSWREALADPEAKAIWCARGGYGVMRLLPELDLAPLRARPRHVIGFSDVTALHLALAREGVASAHGPLVSQLASITPAALSALEDVLFRASPLERSARATIREGRARGPLVGGNLALVAHLAGTPWLPSLEGAVLFLEDVGEKPYRVDRFFTQLMLSGALRGLAGVALGSFTDCDDPPVRVDEVLAERVASLGVPAITGLESGHVPGNLALPLGALATVDAAAHRPRLLLEYNSPPEERS